jgi:hypothetical protein
LSLADAAEAMVRLTGDVFIGDGYNMEVRLDESTNTLVFNSGPGLGLGELTECPEFREVPRRVRFINGIPGDQTTRNFKIVSDDCIEVRHYPEVNMIAFHDHCRECCDCGKLIDLDARITVLETP